MHCSHVKVVKLTYIYSQVATVPEDILKVKLEVESEIGGEDQTWNRAESNVSSMVFFFLLPEVINLKSYTPLNHPFTFYFPCTHVHEHILLYLCSNFNHTCSYFLQPQPQSQSRYFEPDSRDWRGRSGQVPGSTEEGPWDANKDMSGQSESRFQDSNNRIQVSGNQGVIISYKFT